MSLRPTKQPSLSKESNPIITTEPETPKTPNQKSPTFSQKAISQTLTSTANLANLLPTGTLLSFQLLTPIFTNNGACDSATKTMTFFLHLILACSCFVASFTDSVKCNSDGKVYYGLATFKGLWLFDYPDPSGSGFPDLSKFRIRFIDWVHAVVSVLVFGTVALRDKNVLGCFYPMPGDQTKEVLDVVPIGVGLLCSFLFVIFPTTRHGIGYPITSSK